MNDDDVHVDDEDVYMDDDDVFMDDEDTTTAGKEPWDALTFLQAGITPNNEHDFDYVLTITPIDQVYIKEIVGLYL